MARFVAGRSLIAARDDVWLYGWPGHCCVCVPLLTFVVCLRSKFIRIEWMSRDDRVVRSACNLVVMTVPI